MKALITGASSGIGLDMAKYLARGKHELILVAKNKDKLERIQEPLSTRLKYSPALQPKKVIVARARGNINVMTNIEISAIRSASTSPGTRHFVIVLSYPSLKRFFRIKTRSKITPRKKKPNVQKKINAER